jgi:hypothetical protein
MEMTARGGGEVDPIAVRPVRAEERIRRMIATILVTPVRKCPAFRRSLNSQSFMEREPR